ncbi:phosphodiester glycosidase family protein [Streptomyces sp. NBC_01166]|uniref:phosphodiester glycosidase family protein n=1 Tax=Streptomyces sp. NBC_01166 TaxID=2903755 RepID=UPI00386639E2|nr:phosphodiester glycosidase family protein [Streptomyces sp. NBC_01166]
MGALALSVGAVVAACSVPAQSPPVERPGRTGQAPHPRLPAGVAFEQLTHTLEDGSPVRLSVLSVSPSARVTVSAVHGDRLDSSRTVTEMSDRAGAVAAVNASFFDIRTGPDFGGHEGDPLGVYASDGDLLSEAADGSTALILGPPGSRPRTADISTSSALLASDGAARELDGINRVPGRILGCGGVGGDTLARTGRPESRPLRNQLCVDRDEIVSFRPAWGSDSPPGPEGSEEAVLDARGRVTALRSPAGGPIPAGGSTLSGIGQGADWLEAHASQGSSVQVTSGVQDRSGRRVAGAGVSVIGAGPALVRDGEVWINGAANGFAAATLARREPRTVAGITADGTLLLVTFDGRDPGRSVGVSMTEASRSLLRLGATEAVNLDGGGSATMVVDGAVRNRPADGGAEEREVATAIVVTG